MEVPDLLERVRCVLVRTSHPGNIGAAARALAAMGLRDLALVAPRVFPHPEATALAAGGLDVLEAAQVSPDLVDAIGGCELLIGATARRRGIALEELHPRAAARRVIAAAGEGRRVALLFGNERNGLDNAEIQRCHAALTIPSDARCPSLNLAQAVQVVAWELRMAWLEARRERGDALALAVGHEHHGAPAGMAEMDGFFEHLAVTLDLIDFHKGRSPRTILMRLRRMFLRARLDSGEVQILRGILADVVRTARLASGELPRAASRIDPD